MFTTASRGYTVGIAGLRASVEYYAGNIFPTVEAVRGYWTAMGETISMLGEVAKDHCVVRVLQIPLQFNGPGPIKMMVHG